MRTYLSRNTIAFRLESGDFKGRRAVHIPQGSLGLVLIDHNFDRILQPGAYPLGKGDLPRGRTDVVIASTGEFQMTYHFQNLPSRGNELVDLKFSVFYIVTADSAHAFLSGVMAGRKQLTATHIKEISNPQLMVRCSQVTGSYASEDLPYNNRARLELESAILEGFSHSLHGRGIKVLKVADLQIEQSHKNTVNQDDSAQYEKLDRALDQVEELLMDLAYKMLLAFGAATDRWRWDEPGITLTWEAEGVGRNIHIVIVDETEMKLKIEINAWQDQDIQEGNKRVRHWQNAVISEGVEPEYLRDYVHKAYEAVSGWNKEALKRKAVLSAGQGAEIGRPARR